MKRGRTESTSIYRIQKASGAGERDKRPVLGHELIGDALYGATVLLGGSGRGKTTALAHLLRHTTDDRCRVLFFVSTFDIDPAYKAIAHDLDEREVEYENFEGILGDDGSDMLAQQLQRLAPKGSEAQQKERKTQPPDMERFCPAPPCLPTHDGVKRQKKYKTKVAKNVIVCDDLSRQELVSSALANAMKKARHYKCRFYTCTQNVSSLVCRPD